MKLLPVAHAPGRHCASTAIRDMMSFHGTQLTEAMCFGIGCGLGIWYLDLPGINVSRLVHVRSSDIEAQFFSRIGHPFAWELADSPVQSEESLVRALDRGFPALIRTDIYHLPYYRSHTHFPGHVIIVWGYDKKREIFFVTDTEREEVLEVPFQAMRKARHQEGSFFEMQGNLFSPEQIGLSGSMREIILNSIAHNSRVILDDAYDFQGVRGLAVWLRELPAWEDFADWRWTARLTYQIIERRGTGGGGFRLMYADFLREAALSLPEIASLRLADRMLAIAQAWQGLAGALKEASEKERPDFREASVRLERVRDLEEAYHRDAACLVREGGPSSRA